MLRKREIELSPFVLSGLERLNTAPADDGGRSAAAIAFYLADADSGRIAWAYPGFLRGSEKSEDVVPVEVELEDELWAQLDSEAERRQISTRQLAEHAAIYAAAQTESGRDAAARTEGALGRPLEQVDATD